MQSLQCRVNSTRQARRHTASRIFFNSWARVGKTERQHNTPTSGFGRWRLGTGDSFHHRSAVANTGQVTVRHVWCQATKKQACHKLDVKRRGAHWRVPNSPSDRTRISLGPDDDWTIRQSRSKPWNLGLARFPVPSPRRCGTRAALSSRRRPKHQVLLSTRPTCEPTGRPNASWPVDVSRRRRHDQRALSPRFGPWPRSLS